LAAAQVIWPAESPLSALPLVNAGLGWVIPALVGLIVGLIVHPKATKA
jgi:branched-subunit amino acid permease